MADATIIEFVLADWIEALQVCLGYGAKVYPWGNAPQATAVKPYVLYHRVLGTRMRSLTGPSGVSHPKIQLDVFGPDYLAVRRVAAGIREALDALPVNSTMGGRTVQVALTDDDRDGADADPNLTPQMGDERPEHRATIELSIWFVEG